MSLIIDGKSLDDLQLALLPDYDHPAAPSTRDYTMEIPGVPGAVDFGADLSSKPLNFPLIVKPQPTREHLASVIRNLMPVLFDAYGKPRTVKVTYLTEPEKYYLARYSGSMKTDRLQRMAQMEWPLVAFDPYAKFMVETPEITWDSDVPIDTDILWDTGPGVYTITSPQTVRIINNGTLVIRLGWNIIGSGTNVTVSCNDQSFSLGSFTNTTWVIDGEGYSITKNGLSDLTPFTEGNAIDLLPGANDVVINGSGLNLNITEIIRYKYI